MKIGLCTTTIHVPHVLKLLRKCDVGVRFFVAGDNKTPKEAYELVLNMPNTQIAMPESGHAWKCSAYIGFDCIARRNIAFLEALKWGADVIVSHDDDNIPSGNIGHTDYFTNFKWILGHKFNGIKVAGNEGWFDPGALLIPPTRHRGIPHALRISKHASSVTDVKVGVAAGLVIGDSDIDAVTRMEKAPDITQVHILGSTGVVVDPHTHTVFNSQNAAVIRELVPSWFMMPGAGRHDDIYASLIVQRVALERGYHVHFGPPFTYQQRNEHNLLTDLRAEIDGMEGVSRLANILDQIILPGHSVLDDTRVIYDTLRATSFITLHQHDAACAWLEDCSEVL